MYYCIYSLYHLIYQYIHFLKLKSCIYKFFKVLMNLSAITHFPSLCVEYTSISLFCKTHFIDLLKNSLPLSNHILFGLQLDSFKIFWKALVVVILSLSFKGRTHAYMLQISVTDNKNLNLLWNLLINCISARSAPQILSIKGHFTFLLINLLITVMHNSYANSLSDVVSFLIADLFASLATLPEVFFIKKFIDHWSKFTLIFIIFWIFSNIKCLIT